MRLSVSSLFVLLSLLGLSGPAAAQLPATGASSGNALREPDGKLVTVGQESECGGDDSTCFSVTRRDALGAPDPGFGAEGSTILDLGVHARSASVALDDQGRLVVAGDVATAGGGDVLVARLLPQGGADPSFAEAGLRTLDLAAGSADYTTAVAIQPDGKIVVSGLAVKNGGGIAVVRLNADGSPDAGFGQGGTALIGPRPGGTISGGPIAIQADGKIVVLGVESSGIERRLFLTRLSAAGTVDPTFGGGAPVTASAVPGSYGQLVAKSVFLDGSGRVYAAATERTEEHCCTNGVVARFDAAGAPDPGFRGEGDEAGIGKLLRSELTSASLLPDGSVFIGGAAKRGIVVARLGAEGKPLPTYDAGGRGVVSISGLTTFPEAFFPNADGSATALAFPRGASCRLPGEKPRWRHCHSEATVAYDSSGALAKAFGGGVGFLTRPPIHVCRFLPTTACGIDIGFGGLRRLAKNSRPRTSHLRGRRLAFRVRCDRRLETRCEVTTRVTLGSGPPAKKRVSLRAGTSRLVLLPAPPGLAARLRSSPTHELRLPFSQAVFANGLADWVRGERLRLLGG